MPMFRLAICDDERVFLQGNHAIAGAVLTEAGIDHSIDLFQTAAALAQRINENPAAFDMIILDILLKGDNGIALARHIRDAGYDGDILFVTSSRDYSLDGYSVRPIHYLIKPLEKEALREVLLERRSAGRKVLEITVPIKGGVTSVMPSRITHIESLLRMTLIHTQNRVVETAAPLKEIYALLPVGKFIQCHRSYIVSMAQIRDLTRTEITLKSGVRIPVGRVFADSVLSQFIEYMGGE